MSDNSFGRLFRITTFGESHGPAIGCVIDGCPPGLGIDAAEIQRELARRATGKSRHTSQRKEKDEVQIISGVFEGRTTGTPIALLIKNTDARSKDYTEIAEKFLLKAYEEMGPNIKKLMKSTWASELSELNAFQKIKAEMNEPGTIKRTEFTKD